MAVFLLSSPHNGMRVHVSLTMAFHLKNGPTWYAVSWNTTNPYARLLLITACPTKPSDASFVLLAPTKQDKPLSSPCLCVRTLVWGVTIHAELGSHAIPIVISIQRADTLFSHVHTLEACLLRGHCLSLHEHATVVVSSAQKQCSRGGRKKPGSHLDEGREKAAGRTTTTAALVRSHKPLLARKGSVFKSASARA